jgi:hypothetical protein
VCRYNKYKINWTWLIVGVIIHILRVAAIGISLLILLIVFNLFQVKLDHDRILSQYESEFRTLAHPPNTSTLSYKGMVTRSSGNGTNCFYFVGEIREFSGDKSRIKTFYDREVEFLENGKFGKKVPFGLDELSNWEIPLNSSSEKLYLIFFLTANYDEPSNFDLRCH